MTRAVLCNLGFEYELAGRQPPRIVDERAARWNHILRLVPGFEDAPLPMPDNYDELLSDSQIYDLIAYMLTLHD